MTLPLLLASLVGPRMCAIRRVARAPRLAKSCYERVPAHIGLDGRSATCVQHIVHGEEPLPSKQPLGGHNGTDREALA